MKSLLPVTRRRPEASCLRKTTLCERKKNQTSTFQHQLLGKAAHPPKTFLSYAWCIPTMNSMIISFINELFWTTCSNRDFYWPCLCDDLQEGWEWFLEWWRIATWLAWASGCSSGVVAHLQLGNNGTRARKILQILTLASWLSVS